MFVVVAPDLLSCESDVPRPIAFVGAIPKERALMPRSKSPALAVLLVAIFFALTACSSHGGKLATGWVSSSPITVAMITHETPGDPFWDLVRKGAQDASAKNNVTLRYYSDPSAAQQAELVQNAIDQKVDGIALTLAKPNAMADVVRKAKDANIPVVAFNSGMDNWRSIGAMEYFGSDEAIAGTEFGERLNSIGAKHALCVIQEQGQVALGDAMRLIEEGVPREDRHALRERTEPAGRASVHHLETAARSQHRSGRHAGCALCDDRVAVNQPGREPCQGGHLRHEQAGSASHPTRQVGVGHRSTTLPAGLPRG